jgi:hypothetical protein
MADVVRLNMPTKLLDRWRPVWRSDDFGSEYQIVVSNGHLTFTGRDLHDDDESVRDLERCSQPLLRQV